MPISTNLWRAQIGTFGIMIAKLCVMNTCSSFTKGAYIKYVGGGGWSVLQIFQKNFRSPGDHRPKYFMDQ